MEFKLEGSSGQAKLRWMEGMGEGLSRVAIKGLWMIGRDRGVMEENLEKTLGSNWVRHCVYIYIKLNLWLTAPKGATPVN